MKKTNIQICDNCRKENPLYRETCLECGHYLRKTVVNIDLWSTIWKLFETPQKVIKNIIYAEHKNFVFFLLLLLSVKFYSFFVIVKFSLNPLAEELKNFFLNASMITIIFFTALLIFAKIITILINLKEKKIVRFKDNISVITYSFVPLILISIVLFPIEYGIFGKQWFTSNPSPLIIKKNAAYLLYGIEIFMLLWSLFILYLSFYIQSNSMIKAVLFVVSFILTIYGIISFSPLNII
jgi:hypothetical protein